MGNKLFCGSVQDDIWQDSRIVWDATKLSKLQLINGERLQKEFHDVEDCTSQSLGTLKITTLRFIWVSKDSSSEKTTLPSSSISIGLKSVQCVHFNVSESSMYGRSRSTSITALFNNETYEFSFCCKKEKSMEMFGALESWHKRYKASRVFRETLIREFKMSRAGKFIVYYPEILHKKIPHVDNVASTKKFEGDLYLSDYRFVWSSSKSSVVNVSVPYNQIKGISKRRTTFGEAILVSAGNVSISKKPSHFPQTQCGEVILAFIASDVDTCNWIIKYVQERSKIVQDTPFYMPHDGKVEYKDGRWMICPVMAVEEEGSELSQQENIAPEISERISAGSMNETNDNEQCTKTKFPTLGLDLPTTLGEYVEDNATTRKRAKLDAMEAMSPAARAYKSEPKCVVCLDKRVNVVFDPCGHMCSCAECGAELKECPMCRSTVVKSLKVFVINN